MINEHFEQKSVEEATSSQSVGVDQSQDNEVVTIVQSSNSESEVLDMENNDLESSNDKVTIVQCAEESSVIINQCGEDREEGIGKREEENGNGERVTDDGVGDDGEEVKVRKVRAKETRRRRTKGFGGLQLEKTGIWTLRCIINGKRVSKSTGTRDRAEAEQFAKRFMAPYVKDDPERTYENIQAAVMTERHIAAMREEESKQINLVDLWKEYSISPMRRDLAQTTMFGKEQVVRVFVEYMQSLYPEVLVLKHITREHTENYLNYLRKDHAATTYNNRLCVLREVFRTVKDKAGLKTNPWDGFPLRADDSHTRRELTIEELARLVDMASRESAEFRTLFGIAMYTGLRLGDCCKLTWAEVDIVRSIIQKVPEKTKKYRKGRPVTIPIHKVLSDLLMQTPIEKRTGYVLPTIGEWAALGQRGMSRIHHRIGKIFHNAGIVTSVAVEGRKWKAPEASFHSLRHTFVSMSANAGVPLHIVQAIVGHESTAMTRHYYHENVAALQRAVEAIPSISETGDVTEGRVAQPDRARFGYNGYRAPGLQTAAPKPILAQPAPTVIEYVPEPTEVVRSDGVVRVNPHAEAPLEGRFAERSAKRREDKLAVVEAANQDAQNLGGWGEPLRAGMREEGRGKREDLGNEKRGTGADRKDRNAWIGRCVRRWSQDKQIALLEGTTRLVGNGGYRFLQQLWESGSSMSLEEAVDALEVFLEARK